jgi:hypothetical protein
MEPGLPGKSPNPCRRSRRYAPDGVDRCCANAFRARAFAGCWISRIAGQKKYASEACCSAGQPVILLLIAGAGLLLTFFAIRTLNVNSASFERAVVTAMAANKTLLVASKGETASLKAIELQGSKYRLIFDVAPIGTTTIFTDASGAILQSATRQ